MTRFSPDSFTPSVYPEVISVSQLNHMVKHALEQRFDQVSVVGEIANYSRPLSGHVYFTLKDSHCQLRCVLFRARQLQDCLHLLKDGVAIEATGQITLYSQSGQYQMIVSTLKLQGDGLLKQQFLALKSRLSTQGLFDPASKKALPTYPRMIGVVSSPSAAGLQDFLITLKTRYPLCHVRIFSSPVQGNQADGQLINALRAAQRDSDVDTIVFCRGGGSMEDLWCFNSEALAQAIFQCPKPVVSAIGHEKDFTICDLVADVRAATPTAAAILIAPDINQINQHIQLYSKQIHGLIQTIITQKTLAYRQVDQRICHPRTVIQDNLFRINILNKELLFHISHLQNQMQERYKQLHLRVGPSLLSGYIQHTDLTIHHHRQRLAQFPHSFLSHKKHHLRTLCSQLDALNPLNVLKRGYGIVKHNNKVIQSTQQLKVDETLSLTLHDGTVTALITEIK